MSDTRLVHILGWPTFLNYVRPDQPHSPRWRPPQINLPTAELADIAEVLTPAELDSYVRLLLAYADSPLLDADDGPTGARRLRYETATRALRSRNNQQTKLLRALEEAGLIIVTGDFSPRIHRAFTEQTKTQNQNRLEVQSSEPFEPFHGDGRGDLREPGGDR